MSQQSCVLERGETPCILVFSSSSQQFCGFTSVKNRSIDILCFCQCFQWDYFKISCSDCLLLVYKNLFVAY